MGADLGYASYHEGWGSIIQVDTSSAHSQAIPSLCQAGSFRVLWKAAEPVDPTTMCSLLDHFCFKMVPLVLSVVMKDPMLVD